jgi:uncharacterized protein (TIGR02646 family)
MIRVSRKRKDERGRWIEPDRAWFATAKRLTERAMDEGRDHQTSEHYRHPQVQMALEKLFREKCAYCERRVDEPEWDVDHYRPKGRVAEREDHPGYHWLTYTWGNLYLVCKFCNQRRKDRPHWDSPSGGPAQGKYDQFPVHDEADRAMSPDDDLHDELPYLLDPCEDQPSEHLRYGIDGELQAVPNFGYGVFGSETIRICHLNRERLKRARKRKIARMSKLLELLAFARATKHLEFAAGVEDMLDDQLAAASEFAGLARAVLDDPEAFGGMGGV